MFTTFQAGQGLSDANAAQSRNPAKTRRQSSTTHACEECRRRKIRCDGKLPCSHCEWYKHPKLCKYSKKQPRVIPSQKLLDELNASLRQSQKVLQQLFPNADLNQLGDLPRGELVELINSANEQTPSSGDSTSPKPVSEASGSSRMKGEDAGAHLEALEQEPVPYASWDESRTGPNGIPSIPDDVNALSMKVSRQSSYLGVSSIAAALRVISKINKALELVILRSPPRTEQGTRSNSPRRTEQVEGPQLAISNPTLSESQMVDAYFYHLHPLIPMIDETRFRVRFSAGERKDPSWLALLYMVFALGIIAGSTAEDNSHLHYYNQAKSCIDLDMFGNGHIEALQALGLMGGLYLHYESKPNMANAIMGAAMRMACALGLHREYADGPAESRPDFVKRALLIPREVRRRTWWSLFCMDTWATTTQGRPSLGRISAAVTVLPPSYLGDPPNLSNPAMISDDDAFVLILSHEATFCRLATRIQDRLAETPLLPPEETARFDAELLHWRANLPPMFHSSNPCPARAETPRAIMSWRFHNLRLVLYRPLLLNNALRSSLEPTAASSSSSSTSPSTPYPSVSSDESLSVSTCRSIAIANIADIRLQWRAAQISGWNAVWMLFQASMVPLVSIFAEYNRRDFEKVAESQRQIEGVIELLGGMVGWSPTVRQTRNFMIKIWRTSCEMTALEELRREQVEEGVGESVDGMEGLQVDAMGGGPVGGSGGGGVGGRSASASGTVGTRGGRRMSASGGKGAKNRRGSMRESRRPGQVQGQSQGQQRQAQSQSPRLTQGVRFNSPPVQPAQLPQQQHQQQHLHLQAMQSQQHQQPPFQQHQPQLYSPQPPLLPSNTHPHPQTLSPLLGPGAHNMPPATALSAATSLGIDTAHASQMQQQQQQHAPQQRIPMQPHTTFMTQDELNSFWQQVMWGEGDMPDYLMDTGFDYEFVPGGGVGGGGGWG